MGMFRWQRGSSIYFYELMLMEMSGDEIVIRLKHFSPQLVPWEETTKIIEFVLVQLEDTEAILLQRNVTDPPWMVYRRENEQIFAYFEREHTPTPITEQFLYTKQ